MDDDDEPNGEVRAGEIIRLPRSRGFLAGGAVRCRRPGGSRFSARFGPRERQSTGQRDGEARKWLD